jgi:hypothetical protein
MDENTTPHDSAGLSLADIAAAVAGHRVPPVETWHPAHCGDSDMRIAADGTWFHAGTPIGRPELVRLFSTILRREADGSYVLVTPGEKLDIAVDDAPFVAVEATVAGEGPAATIAFRLNTGEHVIAGADNILRVETAPDGTPRPYLHVRRGLEALVVRAVFYQLADLALAADPPGVWSNGGFFPFSAA